jgi:hypothetical protein
MAADTETFTVEGSATAGFVAGASVPTDVAQDAAAVLGSRQEIEAEIDRMLSEVREFYAMEPDQVMRVVAALSARCTELVVHLHRVEGKYREFKQIRTMQIQPLLLEMDRQFKLASRGVEIRRQDLELMRG